MPVSLSFRAISPARWIALVFLLALVTSVSSPTLAGSVGTQLVVTSTSDTSAIDSACTLREAIQSANTNLAVDTCASPIANGVAITPPYVINFNLGTSGPYFITLGSISASTDDDLNVIGDLDVKANVTIQNFSGQAITVQACSGALCNGASGTHPTTVSRVFQLFNSNSPTAAGPFTINIINLTIKNGYNGNGGGGIYDGASNVTISGVTFDTNHSGNSGGAVSLEAPNGSSLSIKNSTFYNNIAENIGNVYSHLGTGTLTITNSTFFGNTSSASGGSSIYNGGGTVTVNNTIMMNGVTGANCAGTIAGTNNFGSGCTGDQSGTLGTLVAGTDIASSLASNGGPTQTFALLTGSKALDAGSDSAATTASLTTDQRGAGFDRKSGTHVDVGAYELQSTPAVVTDVSATTSDGYYNESDMISITVTFDKAVEVAGTPQLTLETGATDRTANYSSGSGTATLTFTYTVQAGDTSSDLDYTSTTALSAGVSIKNGSTDATLTLPSPGATHSLGANKDIVIDTTAPTTTITSGQSGTISDNTPSFDFTGDDGSGSGVDHFECSVDSSSDGDFATCTSPYETSTLGDGAHTVYVRAVDKAGNKDATPDSSTFTVDATAPTVKDVTSSTPDGYYKAGSVISIQVVFTETVNVTGTPQLTLETGATDQTIDYVIGNGSDTLTFSYTVQAGDTSSDLDYTGTTALTGTIKDTVGNSATLTLASPGATHSLGANKDIVIDTTAPTTTITSGPNGTTTGDSTPSFDFTGDDGSGSGVDHFECSTDSSSDGDFATCSSPYTTSTLGDGSHTVYVRAVDKAGNKDATPDSHSFTVDTSLPTVAPNSVPDVTTAGGSTYTFTLDYSDDTGIDVSTLDSSDVRVTGPNGFDQLATFVTVDTNSNGTPRTATYSFTPPGGAWDTGDSGTYTVSMESGQVKDVNGNSVASGSIDSFDVTLAAEINVTDGTNTVADGGSFTFPGTNVGSPVQQTFTIQNTGNDSLTVDSLSLPSGFSQIGPFPSSVAANSSETFTVQCDAGSAASFTGTLSFNDSDSNKNPYNFDLTCAVGVPEITVFRNDEQVSSGDQVEFKPDETIIFTVRNDGSGDLTLSPVDLNGDFFSLEDDLGDTTLSPSETTTFAVTCDEDTEDEQFGQVSLSSNDSDENPFLLDLRCAPHHDKSTTESTPEPAVETFLCTNTETRTGGAIRIGAGQATMNGATGDIYCNLLAQDGVLNNNGAGIGDPNVLALGVIQAVDLYGLLPGGYSTDTFTGPVHVCLRGSGGVLFMHYNPATQQRELSWLPAVQEGEYTCVDVPSAGIVVLVSGGNPPAAPAAQTQSQPQSNALSDCTVTTLYAARLRAEPNTGSDILTTVPYNLSLQATEAVDGWIKVIYGNQQGWISADLLSKAGNCG